MNDNQLIEYKNKPIRNFFNSILKRIRNRFDSNIKFDEETEEMLKTEFQNEGEYEETRKLLEELLLRNNNVLETLDIRMLHKDKVELFGKAILERIANNKLLQSYILELSSDELQTYKYIMNYKVTDINERLGNVYPHFCKGIKLKELQSISSEQKTKAISILLSDSAFTLSNINALESYYERRKEACQEIINNPKKVEEEYEKYDEYMNSPTSNIPYQLLSELEDLSNEDRIKYAIIEAKYGMSLNKAKVLCNAFGRDIDKIEVTQEQRIIQELKDILKENNIERLKQIGLEEDNRNYEGTMNIVSNLKNSYLKKYKETLYQINDEDYIGSQTIKLKGLKNKKIDIYNVLGKNNNKAEFNMILTSIGGIFNYYHDYSDFNADWDRADSNHTISCSYIGNDCLAVVDDRCLLGFSDVEDNQLLQARNQDAGVIDLPFEQYESLNNNTFLSPQNMINETKKYNELAIERKIEKEGKLVNRKPSYVVYMAENIEEINEDKNERWKQAKKMAGELDIPIVVIDVTQCTKLEFEKVQEMTRLVKEENRMDLIPEILQKIENNRSAQQGGLKNIRNEIFSIKSINKYLEQIIGKIIISNSENANKGIEEFVRTTRRIKQVYQERENSMVEECKTYNYDEYIGRLKTLYISKNGLDENGNTRNKENIIDNLAMENNDKEEK